MNKPGAVYFNVKLEGILDGLEHFRKFKWLSQCADSPELFGKLERGWTYLTGEPGHGNDLQSGKIVGQFSNGGDTSLLRHLQVTNHQVGRTRP